MPVRDQLVELMTLGGGLNLTSDPLHVKDTETPDCLNVDFDTRGAVRKRDGMTLRGTADTNAAYDHLLPFRRSNGTSVLLITRPGFATRSMDSSYALSDITSSTQTASSVNAGIVAGDSAWIVNGVDGTLKYDGSTAVRYGTTVGTTANHPLATSIAFHKNRLFLGGGANKSRVWFTGSDATPTDLTIVKTTSFIDFDPDDGDEVVALVPFLDQLTVFKRNKIFTLRGNDPRSFVKVLANPSLGTVAPRTVAAWDKGVMFLSYRGVFSFDGAKVTRVSEKIDPALNTLPVGNLDTACGVVYQQRYYLFVNEVGANAYNDTVYVFDFVTGTWTKYRSWEIRHAAIWNRVGGEELFGTDDNTRNKVFQLRTGATDNGGAISAYFTTKWLDFGVPERRKMGRRLYTFFTAEGAYSVSVDIAKGYQSAQVITKTVSLDPSGMTWGSSPWGSPTLWGAGKDVIRARLAGLGTSPAFRIKVYDNSVNPWTLLGLSFVLKPRNLA